MRFNDRYLILAEKKINPFTHSISYTTAPLDHTLKIRRRVSHFNSIIFRMANIFKHLSTFQKGLGRDAAPVQANPTQRFPFYNSDFHSQLGCPDGRDIAAWPASNYNEVKFIHGHRFDLNYANNLMLRVVLSGANILSSFRM